MNNTPNIEELVGRLVATGKLDEVVERVLQKKKELEKRDAPLDAWFLGPKAEHGDLWLITVDHILRDYIHWRRNYFPQDPIIVNRDRLRTHDAWIESLKFEIDKVLNLLKAHFPIYSPRYNAHMVSEQTFPSVVGYFAAMLYNPNNVTEESAPITLELELGVGQMVAEMLGYNPKTSWAHICSGGTLANLEALWIARMVQMLPLAVKDFCVEKNVRDFMIKTPNGRSANIRDLSTAELLSQQPSESVTLIRKLAGHLLPIHGPKIVDELNSLSNRSRFSVGNKGVHRVLSEIGLKPVIFVSEAAHYSIRKAANLLGYGEDCVMNVPVDSHFRLRVDTLRERIRDLDDDCYVAAVIAVAGTTEEGAVDPIHEIEELRAAYVSDANRSFWFHVDAAWGGYIRSIFCGHDPAISGDHRPPDEVCNDYFKKIGMHEQWDIDLERGNNGNRTQERRKLQLEWNDPAVYSAFLAMPVADSITVDPHKLGYVPYPAGIIAFQNRLVTELITQKAQYITDEKGGVSSLEGEPEIKEVGPFIVEGSKPGAAAAACWLSHKTIPLNFRGHGKIIKTSLLNARKLAHYISMHKELFDTIEERLGSDPACRRNFSFELLCEPDTNVVCFLCLPTTDLQANGSTRDMRFRLAQINELNRRIYLSATIKNAPKNRRTPYAQEFFVSRTTITPDQYSADSIGTILEKFGLTAEDYEQNGIFVLRSTVMNPWHHLAAQQGKDYLFEFLANLHQNARQIFSQISEVS